MIYKFFKRDNKQIVSESFAYDILQGFIVTEKTSELSKTGVVTLRVLKSANKCIIKKACEKVFEQKVKKINIINQYGKKKFFKNKFFKRPDYKKAIVSFVDKKNFRAMLGV